MKILGRNPALWAGLLNAAIYMIGAFFFHFTADQEGSMIAVVAVVLGIAVAAATHDGMPAAILGFGKALLVLALAFGLHWSADRQAVVLAFLATVVAMFVHTQVIAPIGPPAITPREPVA